MHLYWLVPYIKPYCKTMLSYYINANYFRHDYASISWPPTLNHSSTHPPTLLKTHSKTICYPSLPITISTVHSSTTSSVSYVYIYLVYSPLISVSSILNNCNYHTTEPTNYWSPFSSNTLYLCTKSITYSLSNLSNRTTTNQQPTTTTWF